MIKQSIGPSFSSFNFLNLLVSTIILHGQNPIFGNQELQKDLFEFYDSSTFHFLFEDLCKKESIDGNNYVDLSEALQKGYAWGLLFMIKNNNLVSVINLSLEEAKENIKRYTQEQVLAMDELVTYLYKPKSNKKLLLS